MREWHLTKAQNRFAELVNKALSSGPQTIRHCDDCVVLLAQADYERLIGIRPSFKTVLLNPLHSLAEIDLSRDPSPTCYNLHIFGLTAHCFYVDYKYQT